MGSCQWREWEEGEISSGDEDEEEGIYGVYKVNWAAKDLSGCRDGGSGGRDFTGGESGVRTEEEGGRNIGKQELKKSARRMASLEGDLKEKEGRIEELEERLKQSRARRKGKVDHWTGKSLELQKVLDESLEVIQILKEELEQKNPGAGTSNQGQQPDVEVPGVSLEGGDFDQEGSAGTALDLPPSDGNGGNRSVPENDENLEVILPSTSSRVRINLSPGGSPPLEQEGSSSAEALTPNVEEDPAARQRHGSSADDNVQVHSRPKRTAAARRPSLPFQEPPQHAVDDSFGDKGRKSSRCVCGAHFFTRTQLQNHMRIHTIGKHFACRRCGKKYYCAGELRKHLKSAHNIIWKGINGCRDCGSTFETKQLLFVHMKNVHNNGPMAQKYAATKRAVQTSSCNSRKMKESTRTTAGNATEDNLETEVNDIEAPAEAETEETEVVQQPGVNGVVQSSGHGLKFFRNNVWWCLCGVRCSYERSLKRHVDAKNGLTISRCEYCSKTFPRPDLLKDHLKVHRVKTRNSGKYRQQRNKRMRLN